VVARLVPTISRGFSEPERITGTSAASTSGTSYETDWATARMPPRARTCCCSPTRGQHRQHHHRADGEHVEHADVEIGGDDVRGERHHRGDADGADRASRARG
jgi:hypothetical protein